MKSFKSIISSISGGCGNFTQILLESLKDYDEIIDRHTLKAENLPDHEDVLKRGQAIRQRIHEVGFHGATALVAIGVK